MNGDLWDTVREVGSSSSSLPIKMCFEGKRLQNRLRADRNESRSLSGVDIQDTNLEVSALSPVGSETLKECE